MKLLVFTMTKAAAVESERAFLKAIGGNCTLPLGGVCEIEQFQMRLHAFLADVKEKNVIMERSVAPIDMAKIWKKLGFAIYGWRAGGFWTLSKMEYSWLRDLMKKLPRFRVPKILTCQAHRDQTVKSFKSPRKFFDYYSHQFSKRVRDFKKNGPRKALGFSSGPKTAPSARTESQKLSRP